MVGNFAAIGGASAYDLSLIASSEHSRVSTTLPSLNALLDGGIQRGAGVYEVCGEPGSGKSQLIMSMVSDGVVKGSAVIYIDSEGSFELDRFKEYCKGHCINNRGRSTSNYCRSNNDDGNETIRKGCSENNEDLQEYEDIIDDIVDRYLYIYRVYDYHEFINLVEVLPDVIAQGTDEKHGRTDEHSGSTSKDFSLIVVDSITCIYNHIYINNLIERASILTDMCILLNKYSYTYNLAVVVTNYLTTKFQSPLGTSRAMDKALPSPCTKLGEYFDMTTIILPSLGPTWFNLPTCRIQLRAHNNMKIRSATNYTTKNRASKSDIKVGVSTEAILHEVRVYTDFNAATDRNSSWGKNSDQSVSFVIRNGGLVEL